MIADLPSKEQNEDMVCVVWKACLETLFITLKDSEPFIDDRLKVIVHK